MLWKKETKRVDALYVDIFAQYVPNQNSNIAKKGILLPTPKKDDQISLQRRNEGNKLFGQRVFLEQAMEKYNESLCYAEEGSVNVSLAYANRSACFLQEVNSNKRVKECLADIELAKKTGYPEHLMPKLERRKLECMKSIEKGLQSNRFDDQLHFDADEKFPCMANVLEVKKDINGNYSVFAKEDVDVGQMVIVERAYHAYLNRKYVRCDICLKGYANLMPCNKCTNALFCSTECQENPIHQFECGLKYCDDPQKNAAVMKIVRGILLSIDSFSNAGELQNFVEQAIKSSPNDLADDLIEAKSKYKVFLKQKPQRVFTDHEEFATLIDNTFGAFNVILKMPKYAKMFKSMKHLRFLMHLISHHVHITKSVEHTYWRFDWMGGDEFPDINQSTMYSQVQLTGNYIHHSCAPNVHSYHVNGKQLWITLRPIKKGDKLVEAQISMETLMKSTADRQQELREHGIRCNCECCNGATATENQRMRILMDLDYQHILTLDVKVCAPTVEKMKKTVEKCMAFLAKFKNHPWCEEIAMVIKIYTENLQQVMKYI